MSTLTMRRGDTTAFQFTISNLSASGLTGCTLYFKVKRDVSDPDASALVTKSSPSSGIVVTVNGGTGVNGLAAVTLVPADTSILAPYTVSLVWDCVMVDSTGNHYTVDAGALVVSPDVNVSQ